MKSINNFIKKRPYLVWYTKNYDNLSEEAVVEAVLNYGNFDDFALNRRTKKAFWNNTFAPIVRKVLFCL